MATIVSGASFTTKEDETEENIKIWLRINGNWTLVTPWIYNNDGWKKIKSAWIYNGGWKQC
jgi:hypothetical protein